MTLPEVPQIPDHLIPVDWILQAQTTVKVWRNGRLREVKDFPNLAEALVWARAAVRVLNIDRHGQFTWSKLGNELKLGPEFWAENDSVTYITQN